MSAITEAAALEVAKKKLAGICDKNELTYRLYMDSYPIHMEIKPLGNMDDQVSMLEAAEDGDYSSPDAVMVVSVIDGTVVSKTSGLFVIKEALSRRLKAQFAKIHFLYLQMFHRDVVERGLLRGEYVPPSPETDSNEPVTEPLEEYDEDGDETEPPDFPEGMMEDEDGES